MLDTNEKSFRCFCGKAFARRDLLKRHEEIGKHLATNLALRGNSAPNVTPILAAPTPPTTAEYTPPDSSGHSNESPLNDPGYGEDVHMNTFLSFDAFLNTMGLNAPLDSIFPDLLSGPDPNFGVDESSQMFTTARLPYLPPDAHAEDIHELKRIPCAWKVTTGQWEDLRSAIKPYDKQMNGFVLPSLLAISRHITGYFEDFHNHLQILHPVTYRPQDCPESPELTLAVAAVGAICRYETNTAVRMFDAAMSIVHARLREYGSRFSAAQLNHGVTDVDPRSWSALRTVQAALLLTAFAVMEDYATSDEHVGAPGITQTTWKQWTFLEGVRRTRCAIFNVLNIYTTVLDSPPALPSSRLNTYLPCSTLEWTAQNEDDWRLAQDLAPEPQGFQEAYSDLLTAAAPQNALYSPFGNLVLINALLQRIHLARQMQLNGRSESLRSSDLDEINIALERWTHAWRQAPESIFDPRNPDASNSFTATSLLGLAFVRLHTTYASCRALREWQPHKTGLNLARAHSPKRDADIIAALLHATQAFAVPVKFGVEVTSRRQFHHWDLQNFVWHLEAATFLSKWLLSVADFCDKDPVSDFECRLMSIIHSLVNKAEESLGWSTIPEPGKAVAHRTTATLARDLSDRLSRIWSRLYKRHNSPWALTELIGESLEEYQKAMARL
ncbi:hypothetical protein M409DRAFT_55628 [Zasmidium cellare ATCC 36951]|uniref:C2H2-type domain-containing protein n=1 Tax=Zasmidium cellare ATCC 36951 TaxID=1080233 RepID=A0A6A6CEW0_ZASCE|nr:uncharacterized protein M409DRAFT_55628 [Zasmidium cellare ATCC 36951]KAF2165754.1 hypothetical protein M409DRAFT_55628 [Zasmidium cellare ATCC 36951]